MSGKNSRSATAPAGVSPEPPRAPRRPSRVAPDPHPAPNPLSASAPHTAPNPPSASAPHPAPDASEDAAAFVRDATLWAALLARQLPDLVQELAPSAGARPASAPRAPGPAERAARAALLVVERAEALRNEQHHGLAVPGHAAAPIRLHVSDALRDIGDGVTELEEALFERLGHGRPRRAPVAERLTRIAALLGRTAADPTLARHARDELRRMARRCARALGETEEMVRQPGRCPWCDSVSLRVFPERDAVLCVNPGCRCADPACDCASDPAFRHLWERAEWDATPDGVR
ncbi:hypothetical protein ACWIG4_19030 [Streptomyces sp. NPDC002248]